MSVFKFCVSFCCYLFCSEIKLLFEGIMSMTRDLQMNAKIGDAGACGLGEGLKTNSSLKKLILVRCACFGLCIICGYCAFCKRLFGVTQRLQAGNQVGDAGALGVEIKQLPDVSGTFIQPSGRSWCASLG